MTFRVVAEENNNKQLSGRIRYVCLEQIESFRPLHKFSAGTGRRSLKASPLKSHKPDAGNMNGMELNLSKGGSHEIHAIIIWQGVPSENLQKKTNDVPLPEGTIHLFGGSRYSSTSEKSSA